jgi:hypothetical protein
MHMSEQRKLQLETLVVYLVFPAFLGEVLKVLTGGDWFTMLFCSIGSMFILIWITSLVFQRFNFWLTLFFLGAAGFFLAPMLWSAYVNGSWDMRAGLDIFAIIGLLVFYVIFIVQLTEKEKRLKIEENYQWELGLIELRKHLGI